MAMSSELRASGKSASVEETEKEAEGFDKMADVKLPGEDKIEPAFRTPGFSRMRLSWRSEDRAIIDRARDVTEGRLLALYSDLYEVMNDLYTLVRTPEVDENGEVKTDQWGFPIWKRSITGGYDEDFGRLTMVEKERFLFLITTRLLDWKQRSDSVWSEAMFAKAQWEERHAIAYDAPLSGTIDDRNAVARQDAAEERYFAIFLSTLSRRSESLTKSMELIAQRLKDSMAI